MTSKRARDRDRRANERLREQAAQEARAGRTQRARRLLRAAIGNAPGNARYWYELGRLEQAEGGTEEAARAFVRALELSPDYAAPARALDELGVARPTPRPPPASQELVPPPCLAMTEGFDWPVLEQQLARAGAVVLPGLVGPALAARLDTDLAGRPGVPLAEGAREHLLDAVPAGLGSLLPELLFRGRGLNQRWRALLSGPTPPPAQRVLGAASVLTLDAGAAPLRWPPAAGDTPFPIEAALPLAGTLELECADALRRRKKARRVVAEVGDGLLLGAGERPVEIGGAWGRQGVLLRVVGEGEVRVLRLRVG